jgi:hypothetical protein
MNVILKKEHIEIILEALETYKIDIEHFENCKSIAINQGNKMHEVDDLIKYLEGEINHHELL